MRLNLFRWLRRSPAPTGRHTRVMPSVTVPGAAAALVGMASLDPRVTGAADGLPWTEPEPAPAYAPAAPEVSPAVAVLDSPLEPPSAAVTLGFADGASVALERDDPRVLTFRAAVEAVLESSDV